MKSGKNDIDAQEYIQIELREDMTKITAKLNYLSPVKEKSLSITSFRAPFDESLRCIPQKIPFFLS